METTHLFRPHLVAGAYLSEHDYRQMLNWPSALVADALFTMLPHQGFGLVDDPSDAFRLTLDGDRLFLRHCMAVTPAGSIIAVHVPDTPEVSLQLPKHREGTTALEIWLHVNLNETRGFGTPDPNQSPLRYLKVVTSLKLDTAEPGTLKADTLPHALPVGILLLQHEGWLLDHTFIPPCLHAGAHRGMREAWTDIRQMMEALRHQSLKIISNANAPNHPANNLRQIIYIWLTPLLYLLDREIPRWEQLDRRINPGELLTTIRTIAGVLQTGLATMPNSELLLQYLAARLRDTGHHTTVENLKGLFSTMYHYQQSPWESNNIVKQTGQFRAEMLRIFQILASIPQYLEVRPQDPYLDTNPQKSWWKAF